MIRKKPHHLLSFHRILFRNTGCGSRLVPVYYYHNSGLKLHHETTTIAAPSITTITAAAVHHRIRTVVAAIPDMTRYNYSSTVSIIWITAAASTVSQSWNHPNSMALALQVVPSLVVPTGQRRGISVNIHSRRQQQRYRCCKYSSTAFLPRGDASVAIKAMMNLPSDYTILNDDDNDKNVNVEPNTQQQSDVAENDDAIIPTTRRRPRIIRASSSSSRTSTRRPVNNYSYDTNLNDDSDDDDDDEYVNDDRDGAVNRNKKSKKATAKNGVSVSKVGAASSSGASWMDRNTQFINAIGGKGSNNSNNNNPTVSSKSTTSKSKSETVVASSGSTIVRSSTNRASVRSTKNGRSDITTTLIRDGSRSKYDVSNNKSNDRSNGENDSSRTFREDFRGTRVFVQGLPESCSWQTLKDHFRVAGNVVFASVSLAIDPNTNRPKGHGIVQFETTAEARSAIRIMRDHPLDGSALYVREDVQEANNSGKKLRSSTFSNVDLVDENDDDDQDGSETKGPTPPSKWKCADPEMAEQKFDIETIQTVYQILKARNQARRRRNYEACDAMRDDLKNRYNVHIDDRLTMWWIGSAPSNVVDKVQGVGRWKPTDEDDTTNSKQPRIPPLMEWRQIMTTKENDACIDPNLIHGLLQQRDIARREKDFSTADALLQQACTAPAENHLTIRVHDESKTWRLWSAEAPMSSSSSSSSSSRSPSDTAGVTTTRKERDPQLAIDAPPAEQCIALCLEYAPDKVDEVRQLLLKFPGREYNVLKKLKQRYLV